MNALVCKSCGSPLEASAFGCVCAACMLREAFFKARGDADDADANDTFPRRFGDYDLLGELDRGGMGIVFRARQLSLGRIVALKTPTAGAFVEPAARRRFRIEAEAAARLQHPHIVAMHEVGEVDGQPFFTMDLVDGPDLASLCGGRPLPPRTAATFLRDIASAVAAAHAAGVLHRDLKPSNVLVGSDGRPRVTDFGLARRADSAGTGVTVTGQIFGSPGYAPPEQLKGRQAPPGPACDVYGLGALLYHLVTGRAPFVGATSMDTLRLAIETEPVAPHLLNPALPRDLETICLKCLEKDPSRRYASAAGVADDVERFLAERPILAHRPSAGYRVIKFANRHRFAVGAASVVIFALATGLAVAVVAYRRVVFEQRAADAVRRQLEDLIGLMTRDLQPVLMQRGGGNELLQMTDAVVRYFEGLPPGARDTKTDRSHANALAALARIQGISLGDRSAAEATMKSALALRERVARKSPDEPAVQAELLWDEWELPWIVGDIPGQQSEARHETYVRRWRELSAQFPASMQIKQTLAELLSRYAQIASNNRHTELAVAAADECQALVRTVFSAVPHDGLVGTIEGAGIETLARALASAGEQARAVAMNEQILSACDAGLAADPGDLRLRERAAEAARNLASCIFTNDPLRGREAERQARSHYRILAGISPENQVYRYRYAMTHLTECRYLTEIDGDIAAGLKAFQEFDALLDPFVGRKGYDDVLEQQARNSLELLELHTKRGDVGAARREWERLRLRDATCVRAEAEGTSGAVAAQVRAGRRQLYALHLLRDWEALALCARESLRVLEAGLAREPGDPELSIQHAAAVGFLGISQQRVGNVDDAVALLVSSLEALRAEVDMIRRSESAHVRRLVELALIDAWTQRGELAQARELVAAIYVVHPSVLSVATWRENESKARVLAAYANVCDRSEAAFQLGMIERVESVLLRPEAEGRLTMDGRDDLATAARLRQTALAAAAPDALEREALGLDERAAQTPQVIDRVTEAGEAAWNFASPAMAAFSSSARQFELTRRERLAALMQRYPDDMGIRFLHAATHRMECYWHFGWDGQVDPARAAFRRYDALLDPFVERGGYDSVRRTRVENSLYLAQLAASVGDRDDMQLWLDTAARRFDAYVARLPERSHERLVARARFLGESSWCAWWLRDWPQLEQLAQEEMRECDARLIEAPGDGDLRKRRVMAGTFSAIAAAESMPSADSAAGLLQARNRIRSVSVGGMPQFIPEVWDAVPLLWISENCLVDVYRKTGNTSEEAVWAGLEAFWGRVWGPDGPRDFWRGQRHLATIRVLAARQLDPSVPAQAARRQELLARATRTLAPDVVAHRMTSDVRELIREIDRLQRP